MGQDIVCSRVAIAGRAVDAGISTIHLDDVLLEAPFSVPFVAYGANDAKTGPRLASKIRSSQLIKMRAKEQSAGARWLAFVSTSGIQRIKRVAELFLAFDGWMNKRCFNAQVTRRQLFSEYESGRSTRLPGRYAAGEEKITAGNVRANLPAAGDETRSAVV